MRTSTLAIIFFSILSIIISVTNGFNDVINEEQQMQILIFIFVMQGICIILYFKYSFPLKKMNTSGIVIPRIILKEKNIKANEDSFPTFIKPTNPMKISVFKITFVVKEEDIQFGFVKKIFNKILPMELERISDIDSTVEENSLTVNAGLILTPDEEFNFRFNKDTFVNLFTVDEYYTA